MSDLKQQFEELDSNNSGYLCIDEFTVVIQGSIIPLAADVIDVIFQSADKEQDGMIDYREFLSLMETEQETRLEIEEPLDIDAEREMLETFWSINKEGDSTISIDAIKKWIDATDIPETAKKLLVAMADSNNDGHIDFDEFQLAYKRLLIRIQND